MRKGLGYIAYGVGISWFAGGIATQNPLMGFLGGIAIGVGGMLIGCADAD